MVTPSAATLIVAAMRDELRPLLRRVNITARVRQNGARTWCGTLDRQPVIVICTGEGAAAAAAAATAALRRADILRVLVIGASGALTPDLEVGDIVVGERVLDAAGEAPSPDADWLAVSAVARATLWCSPRILTTASERVAARRQIDARAPIAVDLESASIARAAHARGIPFLPLRVITDTTREPLPIDFERFRDRAGRISRWRVACHALVRPMLWRSLALLQRRMTHCAIRLADAAAELVDAPRPARRPHSDQ